MEILKLGTVVAIVAALYWLAHRANRRKIDRLFARQTDENKKLYTDYLEQSDKRREVAIEIERQSLEELRAIRKLIEEKK